MATANSVFVSPGVYTSERDLSFVAQSVGVTTLGLVGETLQDLPLNPYSSETLMNINCILEEPILQNS
jgi:hypothetical protein